ncbi:hypothetical protein Hypma_001487 [Hypsizygus marmoreus]|uniref:Uncharacterized protein n=1 Tax=Hypsizygus marmoreus TaxID=39966 RepID=A0A369K0F7_HYPMA|nr:hypothetical protein Hypma_001487 [Hypsizygus marmoreus]
MKRAASCSYTLTPTAAVRGDLTAEFNYTLGHALAIEVPSSIDNGGVTYTDNGDGTYSAGSTLTAEGLTDEEVAAIITG